MRHFPPSLLSPGSPAAPVARSDARSSGSPAGEPAPPVDAGPGRYAATWLALKRLGVPRDDRGQLATTIAWLMSSREPEVLGRVERWARDVRAQIERMAAREW
jgi:hypothetical protein